MTDIFIKETGYSRNILVRVIEALNTDYVMPKHSALEGSATRLLALLTFELHPGLIPFSNFRKSFHHKHGLQLLDYSLWMYFE